MKNRIITIVALAITIISCNQKNKQEENIDSFGKLYIEKQRAISCFVLSRIDHEPNAADDVCDLQYASFRYNLF